MGQLTEQMSVAEAQLDEYKSQEKHVQKSLNSLEQDLTDTKSKLVDLQLHNKLNIDSQ